MEDGGWVATHADVTDKAHAENEIKIQKQQLNATLENVSQGVCMFDDAQRLIFCNKRYAEIYGLNNEETKPGTTIREILQHRITQGSIPDNHESYVDDRIKKISTHESCQITDKLANGRYISVVFRPTADGGWVATHEDVTEVKHREESFRLLFEGNPVPMWVSDRASLRFLAVNEAAVTHYGYSREQFMSMSVPDMRPADDRKRFADLLHILADGQSSETITQHIRADGTTIDVCVYSRPLTYAGQNARLAAIYDVTERSRIERQIAHLAHHDALTDLANRVLFRERIDEASALLTG